MSSKKKYKKIFFFIFFISVLFFIILGFIYMYRKPVQIHKSYTGLIKDVKTNEITGKSDITLDINYTKACKIKNFKSIDSIDGSINIDNIDYNIEGITVLNDKENYIGATASQNGKSKYYVFFLENLEYILLGEFKNDEFVKQIVAPAENELEFDRILKKLP